MLPDPVTAVIRSCVADAFTTKPPSPLRGPTVLIALDEEGAAGRPLLGLAKSVLDGVELAGIVANDRTVSRLEVTRESPLDSSIEVRVVSLDGEVFESRPNVYLGDASRPVSLDQTLVAFASEAAARVMAAMSMTIEN